MYSKRIQEKVKKDYNFIAKSFSNTRKKDWADFELFTAYLKDSDSVLDLGCGNGRLLSFLKKNGVTDYIGIDQSNALLKEARKNNPNAKFMELDISDPLPLKRKFTVLFAIASFHHIPPKDQVKTLENWGKTLKPGGYLFMSNWNLHQKVFWPVLLRSLFFPSFGFRGVLVPWQKTIKRYYYAFTLRRLKKLLMKAGWTIVMNDYTRDGGSANVLNAKNIITIACYEANGRSH